MGQQRSKRWRLAALVTFGCASALMVTSSLQADGLDLRATSVTDLNTLVQQRRDQVDAKQQRVAELTEEVRQLGVAVDDNRVRTAQREARRMRGPAGFSPVAGEGVRIALDDTPKERAAELLEDPPDLGRTLVGDDLVVHQQDIQAVVNALWLGGARAMTLMGQRIVSTTGIKCVGNTVIIKNIPYSPPYVIEAVGDPDELEEAVYSNPRVAAYLADASVLDLGWSLDTEDELELPAYTGSAELRYAEAVIDR